jgi:carboxypeptidase C (cathepsin A)
VCCLAINRASDFRDIELNAALWCLDRCRMFYFFFESRGKKKEDDPVVIWLTGGPGCSSELAVFYENGPFTIANNMSLVWNKFGWDTVSNETIPLL